MGRVFAFFCVSALGCGTALSPPSGGGESGISFEPKADATAVPSVARIHVQSSSLAAGEPSLFQGELSSYYLGRIKSGELPDALAAREIPSVSWRENGEVVVAPTRALSPDTYSLAAPSGLITTFRVTASTPLLTRLWPPERTAGALTHAVYCGDGSAPLALSELVFAPTPISVSPVAGADESGLFAERCFHFDTDSEFEAGQIVVPPPLVGAWAIDPAPFSPVDEMPKSGLNCADSELAFGLGCAHVADDRVVIRTPDAPLLWTLSDRHGSLLEITSGNTFVLRGLTPSSTEPITGAFFDALGGSTPCELMASMASAREHLVLNEELANPLGSEPRAEWVELVNDGAIAIELSHFSFRDGGGAVALPSAQLAPGQYALLVREDFAPGASDVPPAAGTLFVRVPALGTSGLSNGGEALALIDAQNQVISALPALATKDGQSLRRRAPWSPDDDASAFSVGTPTPGAPNE